MYDFTYTKPTSIPDALKTLGADPESKPLAGGQTYIPVLKQRLAKPTAIVDLGALNLKGITMAGDKIRIGAMSTHYDIMSSDLVQQHIPGLAKMASWIGDTQVRHRGTMGGSLANNDPAACYPAAVLACDATIVTDKRSVGVGPAGTRLAINGAGQGGVFRHAEMEAALATSFTADAIKDIKTPADDLNGDIHASPEYRAHLIGVMARRCVAAA